MMLLILLLRQLSTTLKLKVIQLYTKRLTQFNYFMLKVAKLAIEKGVVKRMSVNGAKLELKLNLSPPRSSQMASSCASVNQQDEQLCYSTSPTAKMMMLVGCPRCLMYVMLSEEDPRCPKCKSSVLLDIMHTSAPKTNRS